MVLIPNCSEHIGYLHSIILLFFALHAFYLLQIKIKLCTKRNFYLDSVKTHYTMTRCWKLQASNRVAWGTRGVVLLWTKYWLLSAKLIASECFRHQLELSVDLKCEITWLACIVHIQTYFSFSVEPSRAGVLTSKSWVNSIVYRPVCILVQAWIIDAQIEQALFDLQVGLCLINQVIER